MINEGLVKVNGIVEIQRGKKLVNGDVISYNKQEINITE